MTLSLLFVLSYMAALASIAGMAAFYIIRALIQRPTGYDCHYCGDAIRKHKNQATALYGRYTMRTVCKPCMTTHMEQFNK